MVHRAEDLLRGEEAIAWRLPRTRRQQEPAPGRSGRSPPASTVAFSPRPLSTAGHRRRRVGSRRRSARPRCSGSIASPTAALLDARLAAPLAKVSRMPGFLDEDAPGCAPSHADLKTPANQPLHRAVEVGISHDHRAGSGRRARAGRACRVAVAVSRTPWPTPSLDPVNEIAATPGSLDQGRADPRSRHPSRTLSTPAGQARLARSTRPGAGPSAALRSASLSTTVLP